MARKTDDEFRRFNLQAPRSVSSSLLNDIGMASLIEVPDGVLLLKRPRAFGKKMVSRLFHLLFFSVGKNTNH